MEQIPALLIVVPLLGAPLAAMLPSGRLPWLFATAVTWVGLVLAVQLLLQVLGNTHQSVSLFSTSISTSRGVPPMRYFHAA